MKMTQMNSSRPEKGAFTRVELIVVVLTFAALFSLSLPAFGRGQTGSWMIECLSSKQKLMKAWTTFTGDYDGVLPGVLTDGNFITTEHPMRPWATGWLDWGTASDNTNSLKLRERRTCSLAPYLGGNTAVFKCPADVYKSAVQVRHNWTRVRSVSANAAVGPSSTDVGIFDPGFYRRANKLSELTVPSPSDTWVYIDEHPDSINDPAFYAPRSTEWVDLPASYHDRGVGIAMADGSAQIHRWVSQRTVIPVRFNFPNFTVPPNDNHDVLWMRNHTPHR